MLRRLLLLTLILTLLVTTLPALGQGDDTEGLIDAAIAALSQQLGTPLTRANLTNWAWTEHVWGDTSLGCPQEGLNYSQVVTRGYQIVLDYAGTSYDYRATPDGTTLFLCSSQAAEAQPAPTVPPPAEPDSQPGAALTPEELVDLGLVFLNLQLDPDIARNEVTAWTWEGITWPDTSLGCPSALLPDLEYNAAVPVYGYAITLTVFNTAYELHMTPDGSRIMPCDSATLLPMIDGAILDPFGEEAASAAPTTDPQQTVPATTAVGALVYTGADGNVYRASLTELPGAPGQPITTGVTNTAAGSPVPNFDHGYSDYRWSPTSAWVAFIDRGTPHRLMLIDLSSAAPQPIVAAEGISAVFAPTWNATGTEVAYVSPTDTFVGMNQVMELYAVAPPAAGTAPAPRLLGTVEHGVGCGGGTSDPADLLYDRQAGFMGNGLFFAWLPDNAFLLTPICTGQGLARYDPATGTSTPIHDEAARLALNPAGTQAAAILNGTPNQLVLLNLSTGDAQPLTASLAGEPDQVYWSADGQRLFISTTQAGETLATPDGTTTATVYTVRLYEYGIGTGAATLRFEQPGRGIAQMAEAPGGALAFSFIESARGLVETIQNGGALAAQLAAAPTSRLLLLQANGQIMELGAGSFPAPQLPTAFAG